MRLNRTEARNLFCSERESGRGEEEEEEEEDEEETRSTRRGKVVEVRKGEPPV